MYGYFKRQTKSHTRKHGHGEERKTLWEKWKALLITTQNNAIKTYYVKAKIYKAQQNSQYRLWGDRDEMINHIISEWSKLAQKEYNTRHDWMGKVIDRELCKKLKFSHANKWYIHNPKSFQENEMHKILWGFKIQTDHLISAWRPDLVIVNKKNSGLCRTGEPQGENKRKWKDR